ncbi:hypothetical protein PC9H_003068 [Pleurotus ostreatus]|uniref:DUF6534 domain-containing protein n=1 Tax=Pleurotus ostreatus TaxID=5322 RepID=A0A8H7A070_PLEOS|nr:uncharacterized protein PC9H_003068 [Pleurotus ostreatus]KAF7436239.1 hypothetical protein PC9H_003068 [Pleurotus ostreatus]
MAWDGIEQAEVEYVAILVNNVLWGISCTQTFRKNDKNLIKALVLWLWICDTTHLILTNRGFWVDIVLSDNGFIVSQEYLWASFFTCLVALPCQLFFVYRIWIFAGKFWLIPMIFVPASVYQLAGYIAFLVMNYKTISIAQFYSLQKLLKSIWGVSAVEDTLITLVLFYMLWKQRDGELLGQTSQLLYRVMFIGINTGTWTALVALFALITMTVWPNSMAFVSLNLVISPIYCNTLLANLNARDYIRGARDSYGGTMTGTNTHMTMTPSFRITQQDGMETLEMDMESQAGSNGATMFDQSSANLKLENEGVPKTRTM